MMGMIEKGTEIVLENVFKKLGLAC